MDEFNRAGGRIGYLWLAVSQFGCRVAEQCTYAFAAI